MFFFWTITSIVSSERRIRKRLCVRKLHDYEYSGQANVFAQLTLKKKLKKDLGEHANDPVSFFDA